MKLLTGAEMSGRGQRAPSHNLISWNDGGDVAGSLKPSSSQINGQDEGSNLNIVSQKKSSRASANQLGSQIFFGEVVEEEQPSRSRNRPGSARKLTELSGSGIFSIGSSDNEPPPVERSSVRLHQPAGGASQIVLGPDVETPKKSLSSRKQMELNGTPPSDDKSLRKQYSAAKVRELNGSLALFSPPQDPAVPRSDSAASTPSSEGRPVRTAKPVGGASSIVFGEADPEPYQSRASHQKIKDLLGTGEYKEEPPTLPVSDAKKRELRGCDIFADEQPQFRDSLAGIRQPPGGESSIALV